MDPPTRAGHAEYAAGTGVTDSTQPEGGAPCSASTSSTPRDRRGRTLIAAGSASAAAQQPGLIIPNGHAGLGAGISDGTSNTISFG
jgi:hypothetical protein